MVRTKAKKDASLLSVLFVALSALILGVLLGFAHEVERMPLFGSDETNAKTAAAQHSPLFKEAPRPGGSGWFQVIEDAAAGRTRTRGLSLSEAELNTIAEAYLNFSRGKEEANLDDENAPNFAILPDTPNFAIPGQSLQIAIPFDVLLLGIERHGFLVVQGSFKESNDGPDFKMHEAWINSARVPDVLARRILSRIFGSLRTTAPDSPLLAAWDQLKNITAKDDRLNLEVR